MDKTILVEIFLYYDAIHDPSVWLKTGSIPADINRFQSHTGKIFNNPKNDDN